MIEVKGCQMNIEIEVRKFKDFDMRGGTIVEGFPTVGLVSTIACSYMISTLDLDQICALESEHFPPVSMIYSTKPKFPARIYAREDIKLAVFITEFPLPINLHRPIARTILSWASEQGCQRVISLEGLPAENVEEETPRGTPMVWGVGSTDEARRELEKTGIEQIEVAMISGVSGVLLNEGRWRGICVESLLAEARPEFPDAHAAAELVKAADLLIPEVEIDLEPLYEQAKEIEESYRKLQQQAKPVIEEPHLAMFR
ncbi:MAG: proteasome assembly chaperone family protein [Thermoplasmata archaeon]